jgi:hypothetical protein
MPSLYGIIIRHGVRIHLLNSSSFRDDRGFQKSSSRRDLDTETGSPTKRRGKASTAQVHKGFGGRAPSLHRGDGDIVGSVLQNR